MRIYCLRHGQTNYNVLRLCNDDPGIPVHLTAAGRGQAWSAAEQLRTVPLACIYSSPLPRALETAGIVNEYHATTIKVEPDLRDIASGFEGRPVEEYFAAIAHDQLAARPPGGESLLDHKQRVLSFVARLRERQDDTILVVAHEETMRVLAALARGLDDRAMAGLTFANCEYFSFSLPPSTLPSCGPTWGYRASGNERGGSVEHGRPNNRQDRNQSRT